MYSKVLIFSIKNFCIALAANNRRIRVSRENGLCSGMTGDFVFDVYDGKHGLDYLVAATDRQLLTELFCEYFELPVNRNLLSLSHSIYPVFRTDAPIAGLRY